MDSKIPRKRALLYPEQCNVRIEEQLKQDLEFLDDQGVDVAELLRPVIRDKVKQTKEKILASAS